MKKLLTLFFALAFLSCNDGDFDVPALEFTKDVNGCGNSQGQLIYITSSSKTETMVLTLFNNELSTEIGSKSYSISPSLQLVYRIFDEGITADYFCQAIPPTSPKVTKELKAENSGTVNITTSKILTDGVVTGFRYEITISNLLFLDNEGRIFYERFKFGDFDITL